MKDALLCFGNEACGLAAFIPHFYKNCKMEIFLINSDNTFAPTAETLFWSNLKRKKHYNLSTEFGYSYNPNSKIDLEKVIDVFDLKSIEAVISHHAVIHFLVNVEIEDVTPNIGIIIDILEFRKTTLQSYPVIIYLLNNVTKQEFKNLLDQEFLAKSSAFTSSDFLIVQCVTDMLCSYPLYSMKDINNCIIFSETKGQTLWFDRAEIHKMRSTDYRKYLFDIYQRGYSKCVGFIENKKTKIEILQILKLLISIYVTDAGDLYVYGFFKFREYAFALAEKICLELENLIYTHSERKYHFDDVKGFGTYLNRLIDFGGDVRYILYTNDAKILKNHSILHGFLDTAIKDFSAKKNRQLITVAQLKFIPIALQLIDDQVRKIG